MRKDPDLDPLRSRPDFQMLLMDLAFPTTHSPVKVAIDEGSDSSHAITIRAPPR